MLESSLHSSSQLSSNASKETASLDLHRRYCAFRVRPLKGTKYHDNDSQNRSNGSPRDNIKIRLLYDSLYNLQLCMVILEKRQTSPTSPVKRGSRNCNLVGVWSSLVVTTSISLGSFCLSANLYKTRPDMMTPSPSRSDT